MKNQMKHITRTLPSLVGVSVVGGWINGRVGKCVGQYGWMSGWMDEGWEVGGSGWFEGDRVGGRWMAG